MAGPWEEYAAPQGMTVKSASPVVPYQNRKTVNEAVASDFAPRQAEVGIRKTEADMGRDIRKEAREGRAEDRDARNEGRTTRSNLRKEFEASPLIKNTRTVLMKAGGAFNQPNTPAGDLAVLYAFAGVMDPESVVRENEQEMAKNTASRAEILKQKYNLNKAESRLPDGVREQLLEAMRANVRVVNNYYSQEYNRFRQLAAMDGADPWAVVGDHLGDEYSKYEADYIRANGGTPRHQDGTPVAPTVTARPKPATGGNGEPLQEGEFLRDGQVWFRDPETGEETPSVIGGSVREQYANDAKNVGRGQAFGEGMVDTLTLGFRDELGAAGEAFAGALGGKGSFSDLYGEHREGLRQYQDSLRQRFPWAYSGGQAGGALIGGGAGGLALRGARGGIAGNLGARNALGFDAAYGSGYGFGSGDTLGSRLGGAGVGAAAGAGGNIIGSQVLAPTVKGIAGSRLFDRLRGGAAPQALDRAQATVIGNAENAGVSNIRNSLQEAADLGLPYTLADTSPQMRLLAGSATRKAPNARELAESTIDPRSLGQADRFTQAINRDLGPTANADQVARDLTAKARREAGPLYDSFNASQPQPITPKMLELFQTPVGKKAMARAQAIAANERIPLDPRNLGPREIDYFKRGLDDVLESGRDPVTGRIPYNEQTRAIEGVRQEFLAEADQLYPTYAPARQAYAGPAQMKDALNLGREGPKLSNDDVTQAIGRMGPSEQDMFRLGYRSSLAERAANMSDSGNPWLSMTGAPAKRDNLTTLFPGGADRFLRQAALEKNMGKTAQELLGGSPTAARQAMDQTFDSGFGEAVADGAGALLTGQSSGNILNRLAQRGIDSWRVGVGTKRADRIAEVLLNPNPSQNIGLLDDLSRMAAERQQWGKKYDALSRAIGVGSLIPVGGSVF